MDNDGNAAETLGLVPAPTAAARICFDRGTNRCAVPASGARRWSAVALVLIIALGVRLGVTQPPLEFHPARQFMGANIARHIYLAAKPDEPWPEKVAAEKRAP